MTAFSGVAEWWNVFKIRAGYGVTGVIPSYSYLSLVRYNYGKDDNNNDLYFYNNGKWVQGMKIASNPNPDLKWETSSEINVGLDWEDDDEDDD